MKDTKINSSQLFFISFMISSSFFLGINSVSIIKTGGGSWIIPLITIILGILLLFLILRFMNYYPQFNLFDKNKRIFGFGCGNIINLILVLIIFLVFIVTGWNASIFSKLKYLNNSPVIYIITIIIVPIIYASTKGIKTITNSIQILFFIDIIIILITSISLIKFVELENLKLIIINENFSNNLYSFLLLSILPFLTLLVIPINNIKEKINKKLILGFIMGMIFLSIMLVFIIGSVGYQHASSYQYPEYLIIKDFSNINAFNNLEIFLSFHWLLNLVSIMFLSLYFIKEYLINTFNFKNHKIVNIIIFLSTIIFVEILNQYFDLFYFAKTILFVCGNIFFIFLIISNLIIKKVS